ncbi:MAG: cation:proton antiporter [Candidatus Colwellbacteria bacterium]
MLAFQELATVIVLAVVCGFLAHLLRQPALIGFIAAGALIGYLEYARVIDVVPLENLASIGVALLLFLVGLEMDFRTLKRIGKTAVLAGLGQIAFTFAFGFLICSYILGFSNLVSFYIAAALTFSSTIIVVKLLSEKKDLNSLYGRIVIGVLLVQDFVAILLLIFLAGLQGDGQVGPEAFASPFLKGAGLVLLAIIASRILPRALDVIGRSQEMLYLFSLAWALGVATLTLRLGLSIEIGGFLAGLALATSSEHFQIGARLRPVRDFFIILFFVALGISAVEGGAAISVLPAVLLAVFVLIGNPLIILLIMGALGYRARTSFLTSLTVAQISEFSFVVVALGNRLGHIGSDEVTLVVLVGMFTIFVSSYFILYGNRIYEFLKPVVKGFEFRRKLVEEFPAETDLAGHVVLVGVHRMGENILHALSELKTNFVALDFDPVMVRKLAKAGVPVIYGDVTDSEIQEKAGLVKSKVVISTVPDLKDNLVILEEVRRQKSKAKLILTAEDEWSARQLYKKGADYVILPRFLGGQELARILSEDHKFTSLKELKKRDLKLIGSV